MIYGFIGTGKMGGALARSVAPAASQKGGTLLLSDTDTQKAASLRDDLLAAHPSLLVSLATNEEIAGKADSIFLGVKPQYMEAMLLPLRGILKSRESRFLLISMAAGLKISHIEAMAGGSCPIIRIMPNTPVCVQEGVILYVPGSLVLPEEAASFAADFASSGLLLEVTEKQLESGGTVSGCGPAFADLFMEALSDASVLLGMPRRESMLLAAQMLKGSAALYLATGDHPGKLKDDVCSPAGTTIEGVRALEKGAFRSTVMEAVIASFEKNEALSKGASA